ncbi:MAG: precorrin-2 C(20)-methyltransferase [Methylocapsa sp.]|nr:precorrin-2 C(20)-methyltransferase [Methylocapsa sp.]
MSAHAPAACLYGVGLGPGDPELITIRATKILARVPVVASFAKKGASGRARAIITRWVSGSCRHLALDYPVTTELSFCDTAYVTQLHSFYEHAARLIAAHLLDGQDVAVVCEGDPFFYGSFIHLYVRLRDRFQIEIVPGVTGISGCWSAAKAPIASGDDVLSILPGTLGDAALASHLTTSDAAVIIKIGANLAKIRNAVAHAGRLSQALYVEYGTSEAQIVLPLAGKMDDRAPYFSLILIPGRGRQYE